MDMAFVYILRCADGSFYTGITPRTVEARVSEHNAGLVAAFRCAPRPVELVYSEAHVRYDEAVAAERRIKGWSRAKKLALIRGDYEALPKLAARQTERPGRASNDPDETERAISAKEIPHAVGPEGRLGAWVIGSALGPSFETPAKAGSSG